MGDGPGGETTMVDVRKRLADLITSLQAFPDEAEGAATAETSRRAQVAFPDTAPPDGI